MGDAEFEEEAGIISSDLPVSANILKVGHHGSRTSSSPSFLALVHPLIAVYCAGVGNPYGHPSAQTITNLRNASATVYGTDVNGSVRVITNGVTYNVYTQK